MVKFEQVVAQQERFEKEDLPNLLRTSSGEWVAYLDGAYTLHPTEDAALRWAYDNLGADKPFVIIQVREQRPVLLSPALAFGP